MNPDCRKSLWNMLDKKNQDQQEKTDKLNEIKTNNAA